MDNTTDNVESFFTFLYQLFANIEFYFKKTYYIIGASITAAIVNIFLNYAFIPIYGYMASAYTTLLCYFLFGYFHYFCSYYVAREQGVEWPYSIKYILFLSLLLFIVAALVLVLYNYVYLRYGLVITSSLIIAFKYKSIFEFITYLRNPKN